MEALGSATSTVRTAEQTQTAVFWQVDTPSAIWNRVADDLADANGTTLTQNARLLALMNIALADATIGIWNAKNHFDAWRPVTAIRALLDPTWTPLLATPAFQEYPSAHSGVSAAATAVLASFYGNHTSFTVTSAGLPGVERNFNSFSSSVLQIEDARIYAGFHFRFSVRRRRHTRRVRRCLRPQPRRASRTRTGRRPTERLTDTSSRSADARLTRTGGGPKGRLLCESEPGEQACVRPTASAASAAGRTAERRCCRRTR